MQVNKQAFDHTIVIDDLMTAEARGYDLGDVNRLSLVGTNDLQAIKAAWELYQERLATIGITEPKQFYAAIPREQFSRFVADFRGQLTVFFPLLQTIMDEVAAEIEAGESQVTSIWPDIWRAAGIIGEHPGRYTYGQLISMAIGRDSAEWSRASALIATLININTPTDKPRVTASQFNPYSSSDSGKTKLDLKDPNNFYLLRGLAK